MNKNRSIMINKLILASPVFALCLSCNQAADHQPAPEQAKQDTVAVFLATKQQVSKSMDFPAEILPYEQADLSAKVQAYVQTIKVDLGDKVQRGQLLATLRAPEVNTQVAQSQSSVSAARAKYNASKDNYDRLLEASKAATPGIVAPVDLEKSKNQMLADLATLQATQKMAQSSQDISSYLVIRAPFSGVVTSRAIDPGDLVGAEKKLVTVQNNQILRIRVAIPENLIAAQNPGDSVHFKTDAYPDQLFTAHLTRKNGAIDPVTRTEIWEYDFDNRKGILKAGMFANVHVDLARPHTSLVVPQTAIVTNQEKKFVIRVKNNTAEWVDVRQGMSLDKGVEIFAPLQEGDTLAFRASDEIKQKTKAVWKVRTE